ncbi:tail fiber domain-containing protein [Chitinophaga parva]|uniref:tail fiber domain-containing protein n=1 Tax=Chitinophaga parva TaxID=2169414 RepID=UPI001057038A|nr:tail fiber domain-containing protein [Chitinophaga parva]
MRIYNTCDTAELVLQNRTQNVAGFLYNKGQGVTEFRSLSDSFILNQNGSKQPANFSISGSGAVGGSLNAGTWMVAKAGFYADRNTVSSGTVGYALRDSTSRMRWGIGTQTLETSGDVGSDFSIFRYHDNGSNIAASDFVIRRLNGNVGIHNALPANTLDVNGTGFFSGNLSSNGIFTVSGGTISMANASSNMLMFPGNNVNSAPVHGVSRSTGTKVVLFPSFSTLNTDYAIGVEDNNMWLSVPGNKVGFKFYANDTAVSKIDGQGNGEWLGRGRFGGSSSSNQIIGAGPAAEVHYVNGSALFQGYDRTAGAYLPAMITGGVGNTTKSLLLNSAGYQFLNLPNAGLLGTDASGYLKDVSTTENLNTVVHRGDATDASITINPHGNAFRSLLVYRDSDTSVTYTTFGNNRTAATITFIPDTSKISKAYNISVGAGTLTYYNAGQSENIWRSSNHVPGDTINISTIAGSVLSSIVTNASGHVKSVSTRSLLPSDIGAAPVSGDTNYIMSQTAVEQHASFWIDGLANVGSVTIGHGADPSAALLIAKAGFVTFLDNRYKYGNRDHKFLRVNDVGQLTQDSVRWADLFSKPTTLSGYGITDAIQNQVASAQHAFFNIDSSGTAKLFSAYNSVTGGNAGFSVQSGGGIRYFINIYNGKMLIGGNGMWPGTAPITIAYAGLDSGNVGINTPSPTAKLHVTVMSNTQQSLYLDQKGSNLIVAPSSGGGTVTKIDNTLGGLALQASTGAGNMGIGRGPTTYAKLSVLGVISSAQGGFQLDSVYTESPMRIYSNNGSGHIDFSAHSASTNKFGVSMYVPDNTGDFRIQTAPVVAGTGTLSYTDRVTVLNSGKVGIGTTAPATMLDVVGDIHASGAITATSITQTSLRSLKKEIKPFTASALNILDSAQVRTFIFKADTTNTTRIGFIADEVPDAMAATGRKGVEETNTVALLVKAIQEMKAEMDAMKEKVSQVNALEQRVHDLEIQLEKKNK